MRPRVKINTSALWLKQLATLHFLSVQLIKCIDYREK